MGREPLTERLNPMPLVDPVHRFILFTNAKCGGTTLKAWFFENLGLGSLHRRPAHLLWNYGPRFSNRYRRLGRELASKVPTHPGTSGYTHAYLTALLDFTNFYRRAFCLPAIKARWSADYFRICVTRNPYDRCVSGYLDKLCGEGKFGREAPYVRSMLHELGRPELTFREFLAYLRSVDDEQCATHWRRQTFVLEGQRVDAFVRLEALHAEMAQHAGVVGPEKLHLLQHKLQVTSASSKAESSIPDMTDVSNLRIAESRAALGFFPSPASFLTPETRQLISEIYEADFKLLPYEP